MRLFLISNMDRALLITLKISSQSVKLSGDPSSSANLLIVLIFDIFPRITSAIASGIKVLLWSLVAIPMRKVLIYALMIEGHHTLEVKNRILSAVQRYI